MNRIQKKFLDLRRLKEKALVVFLTSGDPSLAVNESLIIEMDKAGVDLIELGVPFSDPLADGPVIQESSQRSLLRGTTLEDILGMVSGVRKKTSIPIVLMSYFNPVLHYGIEKFSRKAAQCGVDGVIIPDLPADEGRQISRTFQGAGLDLIFLLAPTSSQTRKQMILKASSGFVYFVSITGVTGSNAPISVQTRSQIRTLKNISTNPICVGFGVSTPEQAKDISRFADGVVVGSSVVRALNENPRTSPKDFVAKFIIPLLKAVKS